MYNGWRNWQTWSVVSHLTNDEGLLAGAMKAANKDELIDYVIECLCEARFEHKRAVVGPKGRMACDLATFALQDVDWERIFEVLHQD